MSEWKELKICEVGDVVGGGTPSTEVVEYWNGDIPWLTPRDLSNYTKRTIGRGERSISEKGLQNSNARILPKGAVLLSSRAPIGYLAIAENEISTNQGFQSIIPNQETTNEFLYYLLKNNVEYLKSQGEGTTFGELSKRTLRELVFAFPGLNEQLVIASILSSLDDKIDLLNRQNKTLEALAETLFRQWFVEEADESWEEKSLDELIQFNPIEKIDRQGEYTFFEMKCLSDNSMHIEDGIKRIVSSGSSFRNGDTLLAKITPCLENGKTGFVIHLKDDEIARGSTEFIVMRSRGKVSPSFVYCLSRSDNFRDTAILSMTGTSGRQRVQVDVLKKYTIPFNQAIVNRFDNTVKSHFEKIKINQIQIRTLTQLRDTLLPKLMSGEVRVKN